MPALRRLIVTALAACSLVVSGGSLSGQDGILRYRWTKGDELRYRTSQETVAVINDLPGMGTMTVSTTMSQQQKMTVADVAADGTATITVLFESARVDMNGPMGNLTYDSAKPPGPGADPTIAQLGATLGSFIGQSVTVMLAPSGAVKGVQGTAALREKAQKTLSPEIASSLNAMGGLETFMSDDSIRSSLTLTMPAFPEKAIKAGDSWPQEVKSPTPLGAQTVSVTLTLKGVERVDGRDVTRVAIAHRVKTAPGGMMGPMTVNIGEGTAAGESTFDHQQGRLLRTVIRTSLPMTMSMAAPDGTAFTIQGLTKTTLTTELVR